MFKSITLSGHVRAYELISFSLVSVLALIIWILATTTEVRTLPCASEEYNGHQLGNIWDYCVCLLVLCGPLQVLVGGMIAQAGKVSGKMVALSHMVAALVQACLIFNLFEW